MKCEKCGHDSEENKQKSLDRRAKLVGREANPSFYFKGDENRKTNFSKNILQLLDHEKVITFIEAPAGM